MNERGPTPHADNTCSHNNVNFMKNSPSSGSTERLLVVFIKCPLSVAPMGPYRGTHGLSLILHVHCSKGDSQSKNL